MKCKHPAESVVGYYEWGARHICLECGAWRIPLTGLDTLTYGDWQLPPKVQELEKELAAARKRIAELEAELSHRKLTDGFLTHIAQEELADCPIPIRGDAEQRIRTLEALLRRGLVVRCIHGDYIHTVPDPVLPNTWHAIDDTPDKWAADVQKSLDPGTK